MCIRDRQINAACDAQIEDAQAALDQGLIDENTYRAMLQVIEQERANQLAPLDEQLKTLETTEQQLSTQLSQITEGETALASARQQLEASRQEITSGEQQITAGEKELQAGQTELDTQRQEYEKTKADALQQIADARAEVDDIEAAQWYIQTRDSNAGYTSVESDASSIEAIGLVFPVVFIIVAVLIALTTITRMVEEERSLIGT